MGRGKLTPESAARQKKLIAETRAKNKAEKDALLKEAEVIKKRAAIKAELDSRAKPTISRARPRTSIRSVGRGGAGIAGAFGIKNK